MKFSIIVPVYNVEKFLEKCLNSIINQTYRNFEVIIVNDGSPDNSQKIIDDFEKKYPNFVKGYKKENGGLSDARNFGIEKATGDYLVLVDSDDYINNKLLEKINDEIEKNGLIDVIGFQTDVVNEKYNKIDTFSKPLFEKLSGEKALKKLVVESKVFETAWSYCYNMDYWRKNNFKYAKGMIHEDIDLTPEVILKANTVSVINYVGYMYYQSDNSIMRSKEKNWDKEEKKAIDVIKHYDRLRKVLRQEKCSRNVKNVLLKYIEEGIWWKLHIFPEKNIKTYIKEMKKYKVGRCNMSLRDFKDYILLRLKYKF